jgi:hypothetical protein
MQAYTCFVVELSVSRNLSEAASRNASSLQESHEKMKMYARDGQNQQS